MGRPKIDLTGQTFGMLTVICEHGKGWKLRCRCGQEYTTASRSYPRHSARPPKCRKCDIADPVARAKRMAWNARSASQ